MTIIERLKLELANKEYFIDEQYNILLSENSLTPTDTYDRATHQRNLLLTVLDVLNMLSNDLNNFRKLQDGDTGFSQSSAYNLLRQRIEDVKARIATIPLTQEEQYSDVSLFFTRRRRG